MKWLRHEKSIQNKLRDYQPEVDTDALWEKVSPITRRRRRLAVWYFLTAGAIIAGLVATVIITHTISKPNTISIESRNDTALSQDNPDQAQPEQLNRNAHGITNNSSVPSSSGQDNTEHPTMNAHYPANNQSSSVMTEHTQHVHSKVQSGATTLTTIEYKATNPQTSVAQVPDSESSAITNGVMQPNEPAVPLEYISSTTPETRLRDLVEVEFLHQDIDIPYVNRSIVTTPAIEVQRRDLRRFSLELAAGPDAWKSTYTGSDALQQYIATLNSRQHQLTGLHLDALIRMKLNNRLSIGSGLAYSRATSRITHSWNTSNRIDHESETIHIDAQGNVTTTPVTGKATLITTYSAIHHTYLHTIDIPVIFSLEAFRTSGFRTSIDGGILFPIVFSTRGAIPDPEDGTLYRWNGQKDSPYSRITPAYLAGVTFEYLVTSRLAITLRPQLTLRTAGITYKTVVLDQSNTVFACKLGARIQL